MVGVEGVDGAGDVGGAVGVAAKLVGDPPFLGLGEDAFAAGASPGMGSVGGFLPGG